MVMIAFQIPFHNIIGNIFTNAIQLFLATDNAIIIAGLPLKGEVIFLRPLSDTRFKTTND